MMRSRSRALGGPDENRRSPAKAQARASASNDAACGPSAALTPTCPRNHSSASRWNRSRVRDRRLLWRRSPSSVAKYQYVWYVDGGYCLSPTASSRTLGPSMRTPSRSSPTRAHSESSSPSRVARTMGRLRTRAYTPAVPSLTHSSGACRSAAVAKARARSRARSRMADDGARNRLSKEVALVVRCHVGASLGKARKDDTSSAHKSSNASFCSNDVGAKRRRSVASDWNESNESFSSMGRRSLPADTMRHGRGVLKPRPDAASKPALSLRFPATVRCDRRGTPHAA